MKLIIKAYKVILLLNNKGLLNWISDEKHLKLMYRVMIGKKLNLENPSSFNEKIQRLKLNDRKPEYTMMVDKYRVREYIEEMIGKEYLIPLLGVYDEVGDIDFNKLPKQFVLKCNHNSGKGMLICEDKSKLDKKKVKKELIEGLKQQYYYCWREWPYKNVKPRIICEKYMVDESGTELKDYKFMCFNGEVKLTFVCLNRNSPNGLNIDIYDANWVLMPFGRPNHPNSGIIMPKPKNFDKMVGFAEKLSKNIPFLRIDFYEINGQLYFGELTFYPGSGFEEFTTESYDYLLGSWITLPTK